jgi:hypothetical protein
MKTMMEQNGQVLTSKLANFSNQALTDLEMNMLCGGSDSGTSGNNDNPPPIVKED